MKKRYRLAIALLSCILLLTAGCAKPIQLPEIPTAMPTTAPAETTAATSSEPILDDASLVSLRQAMVETPQRFAVSNF